MPSNLLLLNGKKFLWDGVDYPSGETALETVKTYKANGFEVELQNDEGKTYLYTRRVVKHAVVPAS